jgi:VWFA-related protein
MLRILYALSLCAFSLGLVGTIAAHSGQAPANTPTIRVTSRLVFLDVTVLDKKGHPVVTGLTKDDFVITEEKRPQRIFSFEEPNMHIADSALSEDNPSGKAPLTIFVLDLLNSGIADSA